MAALTDGARDERDEILIGEEDVASGQGGTTSEPAEAATIPDIAEIGPFPPCSVHMMKSSPGKG